MPEHKHLLVRAEVSKPIKEERILKKWLKDLVKVIDMKIIKGPFASYVEVPGNKGITGFVLIETSHIAIHIWDELDPALVQLDVYSCAEFSTHEVIMHTALMEPTKIEHLFIDRCKEFEVKAVNKWSGFRTISPTEES